VKMGSLFVASYDLQGHGIGILTSPNTARETWRNTPIPYFTFSALYPQIPPFSNRKIIAAQILDIVAINLLLSELPFRGYKANPI
jgi:hypothetical protein